MRIGHVRCERSTALWADAARAGMRRVAAAYDIRQAESKPQAGPMNRASAGRVRRADGVVVHPAGGHVAAVTVPTAAAVASGMVDAQLRQSGVDVDCHAEPRPSSVDQNRGDVSTEGSDGHAKGPGRAGGRGRKRGRPSQASGIVWTRTAMQKFDSEVDHG